MDEEKKFNEDYRGRLQQEIDRICAEFDFSEGSTFRLVWEEAIAKGSSEAATSQGWMHTFRIAYSDPKKYVMGTEHPPDAYYLSKRKIDFVVKTLWREETTTPLLPILRTILRIFLYAELKKGNASEADTRQAESQGWSAAEEGEVSNLTWVFNGYGSKGNFSIHKAGTPLLIPVFPPKVDSKDDYVDIMNYPQLIARMLAHTILLPWPTEEELIMIKNDVKDHFPQPNLII